MEMKNNKKNYKKNNINRVKSTLKNKHEDLQVDLKQQIYLKLLTIGMLVEKEKFLDEV